MPIYQKQAFEFLKTKVMNPKPQKLDNIILGLVPVFSFWPKESPKGDVRGENSLFQLKS